MDNLSFSIAPIELCDSLGVGNVDQPHAARGHFCGSTNMIGCRVNSAKVLIRKSPNNHASGYTVYFVTCQVSCMVPGGEVLYGSAHVIIYTTILVQQACLTAQFSLNYFFCTRMYLMKNALWEPR